jgi:hypothetical protein
VRVRKQQLNMSMTFLNQNDLCLGCKHDNKTFPCYSALFCCDVNSQEQIKHDCPCRECVVKIICKTTCQPKEQYYDKTFQIALEYSRKIVLKLKS